jgi:hypothetical protein
MLQDTLTEIEGRIRASTTVNDARRTELLELLAQLRGEIATLAQTHQEDAQCITAFAGVSAQEAMRSRRNPVMLQHSIDGLESSVGDFGDTHPQLVGVVNRIAGMLANMGI